MSGRNRRFNIHTWTVLRRRQVAERRNALGLSQERLANLLGVDRTTVVRWEGGDTVPQPWQRPRLAKALKISSDELSGLLADGQSQPAAGSGRRSEHEPRVAVPLTRE